MLNSTSILPSIVIASAFLVFAGGCKPRLPDVEAVRLNEPEKTHPIKFASRKERLVVEVPRSGARLDRGQRADIHDFVATYKKEANAYLELATPAGSRGHFAVRDTVGDIHQIIREAGLGPEYVQARHTHRRSRHVYFVELSYRKPVAIPPKCRNWPEDVGRDRETIHYADFGCATQRNFARTVLHSRDLKVPQRTDPRSSQRRHADWKQYRAGSDDSIDGKPSATSQPDPKNTQ